MREQQQQSSGEVAGRARGGAIRSLLGVDTAIERRLAESDAERAGKQAAGASGGEEEERKAVVRVVAADMPTALQRRAFRIARDELAAMPRYPRRLEPKRLALALKKVCIWYLLFLQIGRADIFQIVLPFAD
jgi:dynein light chain LC8-type